MHRLPSFAFPAWAATDAEADAAPEIVVTGARDPAAISSATKTPTPLRDIPQSVSVVTREQIDDQGLRSMGDLLRAVPGATVSLGEGNRDQILLRGNGSTADFFVDGLRDDVQYYRGLYNLERVEVLKGPNAMIFGRGGGGGVVNRVTKRPEANPFVRGEASLDGEGAWSGALDVDQPLGGPIFARLNATYEHLASFRDRYGGRWIGINPTIASCRTTPRESISPTNMTATAASPTGACPRPGRAASPIPRRRWQASHAPSSARPG